jgi:hypothetical protein
MPHFDVETVMLLRMKLIQPYFQKKKKNPRKTHYFFLFSLHHLFSEFDLVEARHAANHHALLEEGWYNGMIYSI